MDVGKPPLTWHQDKKTVSTQVKEEEFMVFGQSTIKDLWQFYRSTTSTHGVSHTREPNLYPYRNYIWTGLVLFMTSVLVYFLYKHVHHLQTYPIKTSMISSFEKRSFPSVTICNLNQYHRDRIPDKVSILHFLLSVRTFMRLVSEGNSLAKHFNVSRNFTVDFNNLTDVSGEELLKITRNAAHRLNDMLLHCQWRFKTYPCEELMEPEYTYQGKCYSFNRNRSNLRLAEAEGIYDGLRLFIDVEQDKYYYSSTAAAGLSVIVVDPDVVPFPRTEGWSVRPGVSAEIGLELTGQIRLPPPYKAFGNGFCTDTESSDFVNPVKRYKDFRYTSSTCTNDCIFEYGMKRCGCYYFNDVSWFEGNFTEIRLCSAKELLNCYFPEIDNVCADGGTNDFSYLSASSSQFRHFPDLVGKLDGSFLDTCGCPRECYTSQYSSNMMYADSASDFISVVTSSMDPSYVRRNMVQINVYLKSLAQMNTKQEPETTLWDVVGTFGGLIGLFLGASVLTLTEVVEFIIMLAIKLINKFFFHHLWPRNPSNNAVHDIIYVRS